MLQKLMLPVRTLPVAAWEEVADLSFQGHSALLGKDEVILEGVYGICQHLHYALCIRALHLCFKAPTLGHCIYALGHCICQHLHHALCVRALQ